LAAVIEARHAFEIVDLVPIRIAMRPDVGGACLRVGVVDLVAEHPLGGAVDLQVDDELADVPVPGGEHHVRMALLVDAHPTHTQQ